MAGTQERDELVSVADLAAQLRVDSIRATSAAQSGHATSSLSAADVVAVLAARHLRYDWNMPDDPDNDHLIFSKGHASPLLYALFKAEGVISDDELTQTYRRFGSRLQGHPTPVLPWVEVATGSLGQGLPIGASLAWVMKRLERRASHVWVLCGDGEFAEGSVWEAMAKAGELELGNLTVIVDVNRLGQSSSTALEWDVDAYARRVRGFDVDAVIVDGHDLAAVDDALMAARDSERATVMIARTIKGKGVPEVEDTNGWHGKPLPDDVAESAIDALGGVRDTVIEGLPPLRSSAEQPTRADEPPEFPRYDRGDEVATRTAFGEAVAALAALDDVAVVDGDVGNSTHSGLFASASPDRFFEVGIAEQQLISTAVALDVRGYRPFAATFAAFFSRAYDFIRMAAISGSDLRLCGSHAGVEIGEDGPSQMALEDIAAMRAIHGSTVLCPADAVSAAALTREMATTEGISYLRTTRGAYPVLYDEGASFPIGGSKTVRVADADEITLAGTGVTVHTCLAAADELAKQGISARVLDLYSIKPIDRAGVEAALEATGGRIVIVEDHHVEGGLGSAVLEALAADQVCADAALLAVHGMPGSATSAEQLSMAGIAVGDIVGAARGQLTRAGRL